MSPFSRRGRGKHRAPRRGWLRRFRRVSSGWTVRVAGLILLGVLLSGLSYLVVPAHAAELWSAGQRCSVLPGAAYRECLMPSVSALITWTGRGLIVAVVLLVASVLLHPWWLRRREGLVPVEAGGLRAELAGLAGSEGRPEWLLSPYGYGQGARAFGPPWRPCVRLDVGLGILLGTDRARFRSIVTRELDRLRDRAVGARYLTAGCLVTLLAAVPAASPDRHPASALDGCLLGFWSEEPRSQAVLLGGTAVAWVFRHGAIWSFAADGTATLYLGSETIRSAVYAGTGTIRWRATSGQGMIDLSSPSVAATLTGPDGVAHVPSADDFALPGIYSCHGAVAAAPSDLYTVVLHRIGGPD